ncbi:MAG TPA: response regulator [Candidatus Paceibacterota bacterium]|nr:response regulator [Candidatus Paceibacterota bacterium]
MKKILVVEDDEPTLKALRVALESAGLAVSEAENGIGGLTMAFTEHPDLILLDILMPLMDGWDMLEQLREKDDWGKCVPVIVLTNLSADEDEQIRRIAELGPSFFLVKADWKLEGIVDKVLEILNAEKVPCP